MLSAFLFTVSGIAYAGMPQACPDIPEYAGVRVSAAGETMVVGPASGLPEGNWITGSVSSLSGIRSFAVYVDGKKTPHIFYAGVPGEENLNGKWAVRVSSVKKGFSGNHSVLVVASPKSKGVRPTRFKASVVRVF